MYAAIALQEPARLLQHLFYFIAHETTSLRSVYSDTTQFDVELSRVVINHVAFRQDLRERVTYWKVLYKPKSLDGTKPNTNPKTNPNPNTNLFSCFMLFSSTVQ